MSVTVLFKSLLASVQTATANQSLCISRLIFDCVHSKTHMDFKVLACLEVEGDTKSQSGVFHASLYMTNDHGVKFRLMEVPHVS